jgi:hypothetical protein
LIRASIPRPSNRLRPMEWIAGSSPATTKEWVIITHALIPLPQGERGEQAATTPRSIPGFGAPLHGRHLSMRDGIAELTGLACG